MSLARISDDLKHYRSVFFLTEFTKFLSSVLIRKKCLLNWGSVRSENTRNENNRYILIKEESMCTFKVEKVSQECKHLCSKKLKSVKFRIIAK